VLWVNALTFLGYFFGNMPIVKQNFEVVIFGIIGISVLPIVYGVFKNKFGTKA
jgi:membrane-associated protein